MRELSQFSNRELSDIGICRCNIEDIVRRPGCNIEDIVRRPVVGKAAA